MKASAPLWLGYEDIPGGEREFVSNMDNSVTLGSDARWGNHEPNNDINDNGNGEDCVILVLLLRQLGGCAHN